MFEIEKKATTKGTTAKKKKKGERVEKMDRGHWKIGRYGRS